MKKIIINNPEWFTDMRNKIEVKIPENIKDKIMDNWGKTEIIIKLKFEHKFRFEYIGDLK